MRHDGRSRTSLLTLALLLLLISANASASAGPESVGITNPSNIGSLLDYRLPDWGFRDSKLSLAFSARGHEGANTDIIRSNGSLRSQNELFRESEARSWNVRMEVLGTWSYDDIDRRGDDVDSVDRRVAGAMSLDATRRDYVRENLSWVVAGAGIVRYAESSRESTNNPASTQVVRGFEGSADLGVGLGRQRSVTLVLRALRLSERLYALGRPPLTDDQVLQVAQAFAQREGYRTRERSERNFWEEVLRSLGRNETFSAFELHYLEEAYFNEFQYDRSEGAFLDLLLRTHRRTESGGDERTTMGPTLRTGWSHNPTLNRQWSVVVEGSYLARVDDPSGAQDASLAAQARHLWLVADRSRWDLAFRAEFFRDRRLDEAWSELLRLAPSFEYRYYVQDRVSMGPRASLIWERAKGSMRDEEYWDWNLQFSVQLDLANGLL